MDSKCFADTSANRSPLEPADIDAYLAANSSTAYSTDFVANATSFDVTQLAPYVDAHDGTDNNTDSNSKPRTDRSSLDGSHVLANIKTIRGAKFSSNFVANNIAFDVTDTAAVAGAKFSPIFSAKCDAESPTHTHSNRNANAAAIVGAVAISDCATNPGAHRGANFGADFGTVSITNGDANTRANDHAVPGAVGVPDTFTFSRT